VKQQVADVANHRIRKHLVVSSLRRTGVRRDKRDLEKVHRDGPVWGWQLPQTPHIGTYGSRRAHLNRPETPNRLCVTPRPKAELFDTLAAEAEEDSEEEETL